MEPTRVIEGPHIRCTRCGLPARRIEVYPHGRITSHEDPEVMQVCREPAHKPRPGDERARERVATTSSPCSSCRRPIVFAVTRLGRAMPVDATPSPTRGNVTLAIGRAAAADAPRLLVADVLTGRELESARAQERPLYVAHFATCPNAAKHRRRNRK